MSKMSIAAEASIFFTKHGWVELEIEHETPSGRDERDLWRSSSSLQHFLTRKLAPVVLALSGKKQLLLGCDQQFNKANQPKNACPLKEILSVQGLALGIALSSDPKQLPRRTELGLVPMPSSADRILFFRPDLILDWPHVASDVYVAVYVLPSAVYVHNAKDPHTNALKKFGYNFGDVLKNEFHPMIVSQ